MASLHPTLFLALAVTTMTAAPSWAAEQSLPLKEDSKIVAVALGDLVGSLSDLSPSIAVHLRLDDKTSIASDLVKDNTIRYRAHPIKVSPARPHSPHV